MLKVRRIEQTLQLLQREYDACEHGSPELQTLYSKLAILELGGWLEHAFDEIAINSIRKEIPKPERKIIDEKIKNTNGFHYDNVLPLLIFCMGAPKFLKVEKELKKNGNLDILKSNLGTLNQQRKVAAHTSSFISAKTYYSPSWTLNIFKTISPILKQMWALVEQKKT